MGVANNNIGLVTGLGRPSRDKGFEERAVSVTTPFRDRLWTEVCNSGGGKAVHNGGEAMFLGALQACF